MTRTIAVEVHGLTKGIWKSPPCIEAGCNDIEIRVPLRA
jgi:hypothetical protein